MAGTRCAVTWPVQVDGEEMLVGCNLSVGHSQDTCFSKEGLVLVAKPSGPYWGLASDAFMAPVTILVAWAAVAAFAVAGGEGEESLGLRGLLAGLGLIAGMAALFLAFVTTRAFKRGISRFEIVSKILEQRRLPGVAKQAYKRCGAKWVYPRTVVTRTCVQEFGHGGSCIDQEGYGAPYVSKADRRFLKIAIYAYPAASAVFLPLGLWVHVGFMFGAALCAGLYLHVLLGSYNERHHGLQVSMHRDAASRSST